uniref:Uncharacterized protein n=1 Tax=Oryza brachyantha TaxID=4533 RepID=J3L6G4_ORYBR
MILFNQLSGERVPTKTLSLRQPSPMHTKVKRIIHKIKKNKSRQEKSLKIMKQPNIEN